MGTFRLYTLIALLSGWVATQSLAKTFDSADLKINKGYITKEGRYLASRDDGTLYLTKDKKASGVIQLKKQVTVKHCAFGGKIKSKDYYLRILSERPFEKSYTKKVSKYKTSIDIANKFYKGILENRLKISSYKVKNRKNLKIIGLVEVNQEKVNNRFFDCKGKGYNYNTKPIYDGFFYRKIIRNIDNKKPKDNQDFKNFKLIRKKIKIKNQTKYKYFFPIEIPLDDVLIPTKKQKSKPVKKVIPKKTTIPKSKLNPKSKPKKSDQNNYFKALGIQKNENESKLVLEDKNCFEVKQKACQSSLAYVYFPLHLKSKIKYKEDFQETFTHLLNRLKDKYSRLFVRIDDHIVKRYKGYEDLSKIYLPEKILSNGNYSFTKRYILKKDIEQFAKSAIDKIDVFYFDHFSYEDDIVEVQNIFNNAELIKKHYIFSLTAKSFEYDRSSMRSETIKHIAISKDEDIGNLEEFIEELPSKLE